MKDDTIRIAVVGAGRWGANHVRTFASLPGVHLHTVCDLDENTRKRIAAQFPSTRLTDRMEDVLESEIDGVVIATPAPRHFETARAAIEAGKHTLVEKPLTLVPEEAERLCRLADEKGVKLMVGHLLVYHAAVRKMKKLVKSGETGETFYMYSQRLNLGVIRSNENAWWSLAPHDISVVLEIMEEMPTTVSASGQCFIQPGIEDVVFATLNFASGRIAHIHVSWLDPHKIRKTTLVGSKKMVVFDDMSAAEKLRIYDKGASTDAAVPFSQAIAVRVGDIHIPRIDNTEPLREECMHFVNCIRNNTVPHSDGWSGWKVTCILEAGQRSLQQGGSPVAVEQR